MNTDLFTKNEKLIITAKNLLNVIHTTDIKLNLHEHEEELKMWNDCEFTISKGQKLKRTQRTL